MLDSQLMQDLYPDPFEFFSTAAGPDMSDLVGPPPDVLDVYPNGTPMASAQSAIANSVGSGPSLGPFWTRTDVKALAVLTLGLFMLHAHMRS